MNLMGSGRIGVDAGIKFRVTEKCRKHFKPLDNYVLCTPHRKNKDPVIRDALIKFYNEHCFLYLESSVETWTTWHIYDWAENVTYISENGETYVPKWSCTQTIRSLVDYRLRNMPPGSPQFLNMQYLQENLDKVFLNLKLKGFIEIAIVATEEERRNRD